MTPYELLSIPIVGGIIAIILVVRSGSWSFGVTLPISRDEPHIEIEDV